MRRGIHLLQNLRSISEVQERAVIQGSDQQKGSDFKKLFRVPPLPCPLPVWDQLGPGNRQVTFEEAVGAIETPAFLLDLWASAADMHQRYRRVSPALCPSAAEAGGVALKLMGL